MDMAFFTMYRARWISAAAVTSLMAACAATPPVQPDTGPVGTTGPVVTDTDTSGTDTVPPPDPSIATAPYETSGNKDLDAWRDDFAARAVALNQDPLIIRSLLEDLSPMRRFLGASATSRGSSGIGDQAEFAKPIWEYLRTAVSNTRQSTGRSKVAADGPVLDAIEARHSVDKEVFSAIWGMETNYGSFIGSDDAANALANMATEGRRRRFAEGELIALMKIIERGEADRDDLVAGWAGAMGQTQFMPTTYLAHAADWDGDGKKDVWKNKNDALASAANYLSISGYQLGQPWGIEVMAPAGFDYSLANGTKRPMTTWLNAGLSPMAGGAFQTNGADSAELWLPAGATGPKYLLFKNFDVFKTYNRADSYAFAVGLLSDAIGGGNGAPVAPWPKTLTPLSVADIKSLQSGLNALGYSAGPVDGIAGRGTKGALQRFQKDRGMAADGYPTQAALTSVLNASSATISSLYMPG